MKNTTTNKKLVLLAVIAVILAIAVPFFLTYGDGFLTEKTPTQKTILLLQEGIDTSHSLFTTGENRGFEEEIRVSVQEFKQGATITDEQALEIARILDDLNDNQKALVMYEIAEELNSEDYLLLADKGDLYLELGQPELAAKTYEFAKIEFPSIYELYLGQAKAYMQIPGTPQYVVDDVYRQGLNEIPGQYELYEAFIDWLEKTDRESETIPYYEVINSINPQPLLDQRIAELKSKYNK